MVTVVAIFCLSPLKPHYYSNLNGKRIYKIFPFNPKFKILQEHLISTANNVLREILLNSLFSHSECKFPVPSTSKVNGKAKF